MTTIFVAYADQYQSEVRELESTPAPTQQQDPAKLLESTTDPYAKALLLRDLAGKAVQDKQYDQAEKFLEQAIRQNALSPQAVAQMRRDLTQLRIASGRPEDVIKALEGSVKNNPNAPAEQQVALAAAYLQGQRFKEALPLLERSVAKHPNPDEGWLQALYATYIGVGRERDAVPVLEKLVRRNPGQRDYWLQLAGLHHKAGNKERALAVIELASRQGHLDEAEQRLQLIQLTAQIGAPFEAGSLMHRWLETGQVPRSAQNYEALAGLWVDARETSLAIDALEKANELSASATRQLQIGQLHFEREEYAAAADALNEGLKDARQDRAGPVLLTLGVAAFNSGNVDGAREAFAGAARFPSSATAAKQWLEFVELPHAQAQSARMAQRQLPPAIEVALSGRLTGETVKARPALAELPDKAPAMRSFGGRLTPVGAERDASADGTIPEWTGGLQQPPSAFKPGGRIVDPYPQDKPLFEITQANAAKYVSKLSAGHKALLSRHKTFRMPVYQSRRSAAYPQAIYDATQANLGKAKLIGSDALVNARLGFPFPEPQNGVEVMWNHRVRWRGNTFVGITSQAVVGAQGVTNLRKGIFRVLFRYANIKDPADIDKENILVYGITFVGDRITENSKTAEFVVLFHETANSLKKARGIWVLLQNWDKMMRLPPLGYDRPMIATEGLYFIDMLDMYNGAFDRYVWKLVGKRELYIPYNAYRLNDGSQKYKEQLTFPTFSADNARYELHRVWIVEATERGGQRHAFGKRIFYVDEDTWNVVLVENHDHQGKLWRFQEGHLVTSYDILSTNSFPIVTYDLAVDRYFVHRLLSEDPPLQFDVAKMGDQEFLPAAVKRRYMQ